MFKEGVEEIKDLKRGMILEGTVTNVAAFGAFVDIGVHQDGLVHVSAMSKNFIKDPREVVKPGDIVKVKVLDFEVARKRISLTLRLDDEVWHQERECGGRQAARDFPRLNDVVGAAQGAGTDRRSARRSPAPSRREERSRQALTRGQQIHLGVGDDQAVGEQLREVAHDPLAGARVLFAEAFELADRDFERGRGHVGEYIGRAERFQ